MTFYFAWVDKEDNTFAETEHAVEDEEVFALTLQHAEGDFPSLDVDIVNPRIGLLTSSRKQWAWVSFRKADNSVVPLFFGRLVGVPQDLQDDIVRLSFVARPPDYEDQRSTLADTLKAYPYWDPVFFSEEEQADPDRVLEGRSALWHIDRVTHVVTVSDIITGEDGQLDFDGGDAFYDSVSVGYSESPARRVLLEASVQWDQRGSGSIDITQRLLRAFAAETPDELYAIDESVRPKEGVINIVGGESLIQNWPKFGQRIGGGWTVGASSAQVVGDTPLTPTLVGPIEAYQAVQLWGSTQLEGLKSAALRMLFDRSPGFVVEIEDETAPWLEPFSGVFAHGDVNILWIPIWQVAGNMQLQWEASRGRTEVITIEVEADVQPLLTDADEEETIRLNVGPADVDAYIADVRNNRYFGTDRGRYSIEHLLARARAHLLARARAIDVTFEVPFEMGLDLSCRKSASLVDPRLPGGVAAGKIKAYTLAANGDSGELSCALTIGCTVGRDGTVEAVEGTPTYVEEGYVESGYQEYDGAVIVPIAGDLGYTLGNYAIDDDGVNLQTVNASGYITGLTVEGGLVEQQEAATSEVHATATAAVDRINGYETKITLNMKPVTGGPFETNLSPTVTELKVPRTIDLEEVAT